MKKENQALEEAREHLRAACELLKEEPAVYDVLSRVQRLVSANLPVKMDDGRVAVFPAYRAMHSDALGPGKGGIRFHPNVCAEEVSVLSMWMSLKCAVAGLPYGGGKGGIAVDTALCSTGELERLSRAYVAAFFPVIGEMQDIPAPDVHTNGQVMAWMTDEYQKLAHSQTVATFTGKPVALGGSMGRNEATGLGVALAVESWCRMQNKDLSGMTCTIQGFGNVGSLAMKHLQARGVKIVSVAHHANGKGYAIYSESGLDYEALARWYEGEKKGNFLEYPGVERITEEAFWQLPVDLCVPCALENAISEDVAETLGAKLVAEGANGPVTAEAERILMRRGVSVLPDIFVNSGGVTVSYYEWVQNRTGDYWTEEEVNEKLARRIRAAFESLSALQEEYNVSWREAAYAVAVRRLAEGLRLRGRL